MKYSCSWGRRGGGTSVVGEGVKVRVIVRVASTCENESSGERYCEGEGEGGRGRALLWGRLQGLVGGEVKGRG